LSGANHSTAEALKGAHDMKKQIAVPRSDVSAAQPRSNVIPFPVRPRPRPPAHAFYCGVEDDPLGTPELEHHTVGICELAYSIAESVTESESDECHERVYAEVLDMLCKLTPLLVRGIRDGVLLPQLSAM
jgi:hypothetical protein